LAAVHSRVRRGLDAPEVKAEVHLGNGLPSYTLLGLADTEGQGVARGVSATSRMSGLEFPF
jgi:magnesium chelatase family protein